MPDQDASDGGRDRLSPEMLLYGFVRAVGRFTRSGLNEEAITGLNDAPDLDRQVLAAEWGTAVFEALNWSVTLDERLRHELDGSDWIADLKAGGVVRALRYARNCVHHNWAAALDADLGSKRARGPTRDRVWHHLGERAALRSPRSERRRRLRSSACGPQCRGHPPGRSQGVRGRRQIADRR
jgi:hypothetical protein